MVGLTKDGGLTLNRNPIDRTRLAEEITKLAGNPTLFALHLKATHREEIIAELERAGVDDLVVMEAGRGYEV